MYYIYIYICAPIHRGSLSGTTRTRRGREQPGLGEFSGGFSDGRNAGLPDGRCLARLRGTQARGQADGVFVLTGSFDQPNNCKMEPYRLPLIN